jgi:hypothetical protein
VPAVTGLGSAQGVLLSLQPAGTQAMGHHAHHHHHGTHQGLTVSQLRNAILAFLASVQGPGITVPTAATSGSAATAGGTGTTPFVPTIPPDIAAELAAALQAKGDLEAALIGRLIPGTSTTVTGRLTVASGPSTTPHPVHVPPRG